MNILLTSVGRRSYLVRYFQHALKGSGIVIAANSVAEAPAMHVADKAIVVPPSYAEGYAQGILEICRAHDIGMLCSFHDLDTAILARHRKEFSTQGIIPLLPDSDWAMVTLDKWECGRRLSSHGFSVPWASISISAALDSIASGEARWPLIVKARIGFGSLGLYVCTNEEELRSGHQRVVSALRNSVVPRFLQMAGDSAVLIEEYLSGSEFCVNIVNDLSGEYSGHFVSMIHAMRAGESDSATTVDPVTTRDFARRFSAMTRHCGPWGLDLIQAGPEFKVIDVNPRFTGDYPFAHIAGANVPAALIAWAEGREPDPSWLTPQIGVSGFKDLVPTVSHMSDAFASP